HCVSFTISTGSFLECGTICKHLRALSQMPRALKTIKLKSNLVARRRQNPVLPGAPVAMRWSIRRDAYNRLDWLHQANVLQFFYHGDAMSVTRSDLSPLQSDPLFSSRIPFDDHRIHAAPVY